MKKIFTIYLLIIFLFPNGVYAQRGCCSSHGGVCGCSNSGRTVCCDNTYSPSCRCNPPKVSGCTDPKADNYNSKANSDNGSCRYTIKGCTDKKANNYNSKANKDDGSCKYDVYGCTDKKAKNYNANANKSDGSCIYEKEEVKVDITDDNDDVKYVDIKDNNIEDEEKNNQSGNDTSTVLFYLTAISGLGYYGTKKVKKH